MKTLLGIDIGGSGIKGALVNAETGEMVSERKRIPTPDGAHPGDVAEDVHCAEGLGADVWAAEKVEEGESAQSPERGGGRDVEGAGAWRKFGQRVPVRNRRVESNGVPG